MKVVLVSTYERKGGAAIACYRLKEALLKEGVDVMLLTAYKTSDDPTVITPFDTRWKRLKNRFHFYKERFSIFIKNFLDIRFKIHYHNFVALSNKYADMAEWQTHKTQNLARVTSCGFKSHYPQVLRKQ